MTIEFMVFRASTETNGQLPKTIFCRLIIACVNMCLFWVFKFTCIIEEVPIPCAKWIHSWSLIANCINRWITKRKSIDGYHYNCPPQRVQHCCKVTWDNAEHFMVNIVRQLSILFKFKLPVLECFIPWEKRWGESLKGIFFFICLLPSPPIMSIKFWTRAESSKNVLPYQCKLLFYISYLSWEMLVLILCCKSHNVFLRKRHPENLSTSWAHSFHLCPHLALQVANLTSCQSFQACNLDQLHWQICFLP